MAYRFDEEARYQKSHEWARKEGDEIVVGISDYAQASLTDVVYVELPEVGDTFARGDTFGVVESVKAASEVYAPISGEVTAVNEALADTPELINQDPYGEGWLVRVKPDNPDEWEELLDVGAYKAVVEEEEAGH